MDIQNKNNIFNLEENVAIITNCDQKLCKAIAIGLAKNGVDIAIVSNKFGEMENIVEEVKSLGRRSKLFRCDVSSSSDVKNMVKEALNYFNHIDILINSNRVLKETLLVNISDKEWDKNISNNLNGVFFCCREVAKVMVKQRKGRIINISSVLAHVGKSGFSNYCVNNAAIVNFGRALALEVGEFGITVNALTLPVILNSGSAGTFIENGKEKLDINLDKIPLRKAGNFDDVVCTIIFLASNASEMITGICLNVDGGFLAH